MLAAQCNSCGAFECEPCPYCPTAICRRCKAHHESICEENQKRIRRGEGPTVRRVVMISTAAPIEPVDEGLAAIKDLLSEQ